MSDPSASRSPVGLRPLLLLVVASITLGCRVMPGSSPTAAPSTPAGTTAAPTVASSSPTLPADAVVAFFERFVPTPPPYRVLMGVAISGVSSGIARIEGEVSGADYRADVTVELAGLPPRESRIVFVDGTAYLAGPGGSDWITVPGYRSTPPLNPFLLLDPADFTDVGADAEHDGLRRLSSTAWVESDATLGLVEGGVSEVTFDIWLDAFGVPVEGELEYRLVGIDGQGQHVDVRYATVYTFSDVGVPVTIAPPTP